MYRVLKKVESFAHNPWIDAVVGVILLSAAMAEAGETLIEDVMGGDVGAHHGVLVLGLAHVIRSIPSAIGGILLFVEPDRRNQ